MIQPIDKIGETCREFNVPSHSNANQALERVSYRFESCNFHGSA